MKSFTLTLAVFLALALVASVRASSEESSSSSSSEERILYRVRRDVSDSSDESSSSSDESVHRRKRSTSESSEESSESSSDSSSDSSSEEVGVRRRRSASDSDSNSASSEETPKRRGNNRRNRNNNRRNKREALLGLFDVDGEGHDSDHHYTKDELLSLEANLNLNTDQIAHLIRIASPIRRNKRATCDLLSYFNLGDTPCAAHCILKGFRGGWCDSKKICNCRH